MPRPKFLRGEAITPSSDLASLGYVLIQMLSGVRLFAGLGSDEEILRFKERIVSYLYEILPDDVVASRGLLDLIRGLVAPNPDDRFPSAGQLIFLNAEPQNSTVNLSPVISAASTNQICEHGCSSLDSQVMKVARPVAQRR